MLLKRNINQHEDNEKKYNRCGCDYECPIHKQMIEEANNNIAFQQEARKRDSEAPQCPRESPQPSTESEESYNWEIDKLPNKIIPIITLHQGEQTLPTSVIVVGLLLIVLFIAINQFQWHRVKKSLRRLEEKLKDNSK